MNSIREQDNSESKDCSLRAVSKAFGFEHIELMSLWLPIRYINLSKFDTPRNCDGVRRLFKLKLLSKKLDISQKPRKLKLSFDFNGDSVYTNILGYDIEKWSKLVVGDTIFFEGISVNLGGAYFIKSPELVDSELGSIIPVYKGKHKYKPGEIKDAMREISFSDLSFVSKWIFRKIFKHEIYDDVWINSIIKVLRGVHFPRTIEGAEYALGKVKDLSIKYMLEMASQSTRSNENIDTSINIDWDYVVSIAKGLPFELTRCQKFGIKNIYDGFVGKKKFMHLVNGDVGTGKTETYLIPLLGAYKSGASIGIMVPNEILAKSIIDRIHDIEPSANVKMVSGSEDDGYYHGKILVGTSALVNRAKKYKIKFDVVVIDEEQKFSVEQKNVLVGEKTNVIYSTATCIPRTGALLQYGDVSISILKECPVQKEIQTKIISRFNHDDMMRYIRGFVEEGKQVGVVFNKLSSVEKKSKVDKKNQDGSDKKRGGRKGKSLDLHVESFVEEFGNDVLVLHGKMSSEEKLSVIDKMKAGEAKVLVCSNIIETGITLPDLFALNVFDADFLGVSQLHQLRGRLARHGGVGQFNMIPSENCSELGKEKLIVLRENIDGFVVAERDLELRGFGDLSTESESQTGDGNGIFYCMQIGPKDVNNYLEKQKKV